MTTLTPETFTHDGLCFRTFAGGAGDAIVFLHGGGSRAGHFLGVMERLAPDFRVIAFDMRGFGETGAHPARAITHQTWADDALACLNHFGLETCTVVGWSLGAAIALNLASQHQARVSAMALLGAPHPARRIDPAVFERRLRIIADGGTSADVVAATFEATAQAVSPWVRTHRPEAVERIRQEHLSQDVTLAARLVDSYASRPDLTAVLPKVLCPVTLIVGQDDPIAPLAAAEELKRRLVHATVRTVANCGHYYAVEQPDTVVGLIAEAAKSRGTHGR